MCGMRGVFVPRLKMQFRDILDGLSNTIIAGEIATDIGDRGIMTSPSINNGGSAAVSNNPKTCANLDQIDSQRPRFWRDSVDTSTVSGRGYRWAQFMQVQTQMNTILPPNSEVCLAGNTDTHGTVPPSSRHSGGCHILMSDGAVIFMTESVEAGDPQLPTIYCDITGTGADSPQPIGSPSPYGLWGALGTREGGEVISESLN